MVERLLNSAEEELEEVGPHALSIRSVAHRAGMSPATAYSYLASKDHLFATLFWRRLAADPGPELPEGPVAERLACTVDYLMHVTWEAPQMAAAATISLLGRDPDVAQLRERIGAIFVGHLRRALGEHADPRVLDAVSLAFFGALLQVGMGLGTQEEYAHRLRGTVAVLLEEPS
jgi:AcrR family transcriptional regulator